MKKFYHSNLFYKYAYCENKNVILYTESTFYEKLYSSNTDIKFKKYPDREEYIDKKGNLFIRYYAYLNVPDYVKVQPFYYPSEEIEPEIPEVVTDIENLTYWHNIKNGMGYKFQLHPQ